MEQQNCSRSQEYPFGFSFRAQKLVRLKYITPSAIILLHELICDCRIHSIAAGATMWLQEPRFVCRIFIITFQSSCSRFCPNLNFPSNSQSLGAASTCFFLLLLAKFYFLSLYHCFPAQYPGINKQDT